MASEASDKNHEAGDAQDEPEFVEEDLMSLETLDRASPDLWPEQIPGILELTSSDNSVPLWEQSFNAEDLSLLHHYGSLTLSALIVEVRKLYEKAYQLGTEEAKEMTRGKYLNILNRRRPPNFQQ
ncbi:hypothetical protein B566_EDAN014240 [Ephemera danica]|nr:hypothetical protein B566_EDAN014240 [Ephemera danica]